MPYKAKEKNQAYSRAYYVTHLEQEKARHRAWRQVHRQETKAYDHAYRQAHLEEKNAYELAHREERNAYHRAHYLTHREKRGAQQRAYNLAHREERKTYKQVYDQAHPEEAIAHSHKRRALKRGVSHQPYKAEEIFQRDRGICGLCHKKVAKADRSIDHILPISMGGADAPYNVQLAHLRCNSGKCNSARFPAQLRLALA